MDTVNKTFDKIDDLLGPNRTKYPRACQQAREMVMECVLNSDCFKVGSWVRTEIRELQILHAGWHRQTLQGTPIRLLQMQEIHRVLGEKLA